MNSSTSTKIGAGVATLIAGSVLSLSAGGADARMCFGAQNDLQCVVMPPTSSSTPAHGSGGTFVAGVYIPDIITGVWTGDAKDHPNYGPAAPSGRPTEWVDTVGAGCVRVPWPQIVACAE